jgi:general stress protein 26
MSEKNDKHKKDYKELNGEEGMKKIAELVKDIRMTMMSTIAPDGTISARPMATQNEPFNGTLWFLVNIYSEKIEEIDRDNRVTLSYADPSDSKYIALRGTATISHGTPEARAKIKELWNFMYKAWFTGGEDDPDIAVLRVDVTEGDYWEANASKVWMGVRYFAAAVTNGNVSVGEAGHVTT